MEKIDYKKTLKSLYQPKPEPALIEVPPLCFVRIDGRGNPNEEAGAYQAAVETLYTLCYTIKMMPKSGQTPPGYFDYVVPPLEGLWWVATGDVFDGGDKSAFCWTAQILQPEFVTEQVFAAACEAVAKKKPHLAPKTARLETVAEGLCVQCMHRGSFDEEPQTLEKMKQFMAEQGVREDLSETRRHHEIYLSDPRKVERAKMKTVLRYPVRRV